MRKRGLVVFMVLAYVCLMLAAVQTAFAASSVPSLLITEVVPNAKNVPNPATGKNFDEAYELVEIYNNSGANVSLKDFKIVVTEPGKADINFAWMPGYGDKVVPAGGVLVVWLRSDNNPFAFADFYKHYSAKNPDLREDQIALAANGYLTNSTPHTIFLVKADGTKVVAASYEGLKEETVDDKGIKYAYPTDGSINMRKVAFGSTSLVTPGMLEAGQVPGK